MKTSSFDYVLPPEFIAQSPAEPRDSSRLMVVHRSTGQIEHRIFRDIGEYLCPSDLLVLNHTRVIPARLFGHKAQTGGKVELLLLNRRDDRTWETLVRGKGLRPGIRVELEEPGVRYPAGQTSPQRAPCPVAEIIAETDAGSRLVRFDEPIEPFLGELGVLPLPPYIYEPLADPERYQTVYGQVEGSVAASTAGLHFTPESLVRLRRRGVEMAFVTLHIGLDTFRPVKEERLEDHRIHTEWYELTAPISEQINRARLEGRRVVAVGTTVVRALESAARACSPEWEAPSLSWMPWSRTFTSRAAHC
jgi:S-adenosylmethionine:tRNA ribosyltransferase-isomerase